MSESSVSVNDHTRFWTCFNALPVEIQEQATRQHQSFVQDPFHRSLRLKQIDLFWPVRVSRSYRAVATRENNVFSWFWIGPHDEHEKLLKRG